MEFYEIVGCYKNTVCCEIRYRSKKYCHKCKFKQQSKECTAFKFVGDMIFFYR